MKVYFNQNFWDTIEGVLGVPQKVEWKFTYEKQQYYIPTIYQFHEGITIDIISLLHTSKIKDFHEKYDNCINSMNKDDTQYLKTVNTIQEFPLKKVYIKFLKQSQSNLHSLKFFTSKTEYLIPVKENFKIDLDLCDKVYEEVFVHPLSGIKHHIYINEVEKKNARELFPQYQLNNPFNFIVVSYELEPPLPKDEWLLLKEIEQSDKYIKDDNNTAMSIGVFFRNDENSLGKHGYPLKGFSTKVYWKSLKNIDINIEGIYKKKCSEQEIMVYRS